MKKTLTQCQKFSTNLIVIMCQGSYREDKNENIIFYSIQYTTGLAVSKISGFLGRIIIVRSCSVSVENPLSGSENIQRIVSRLSFQKYSPFAAKMILPLPFVGMVS